MYALSRRDFLAAGVGLATNTMARSEPVRSFFERTGLPLGLQLYTVHEDMTRDFAGTLNTISRIGYQTVELAGLLNHTPKDWRRELDAAGPRCPSAHIPARSA